MDFVKGYLIEKPYEWPDRDVASSGVHLAPRINKISVYEESMVTYMSVDACGRLLPNPALGLLLMCSCSSGLIESQTLSQTKPCLPTVSLCH
jgi:hypothetical protein